MAAGRRRSRPTGRVSTNVGVCQGCQFGRRPGGPVPARRPPDAAVAGAAVAPSARAGVRHRRLFGGGDLGAGTGRGLRGGFRHGRARRVVNVLADLDRVCRPSASSAEGSMASAAWAYPGGRVELVVGEQLGRSANSGPSRSPSETVRPPARRPRWSAPRPGCARGGARRSAAAGRAGGWCRGPGRCRRRPRIPPRARRAPRHRDSAPSRPACRGSRRWRRS